MALVSPAGTAEMPLSARMLAILVVVAAALGAFVLVATPFASAAGTAPFAWGRFGHYALSVFVAVAAGASLWVVASPPCFRPAVVIGPYALIAFAAFAGLASGAVAAARG